MMATGLGLGMWTATLRGKRDGLTSDDISNIFFWIIISGIVGAKLLYVVDYYFHHPGPNALPLSKLLFQRAGLVFQGALVASAIAVVFYVRRKKLPLWKTLDVLAPSIALGYFFGRLGCFMSGCCHGSECGFGDHYHSISGGLFPGGEMVSGHSFPWIALVFKKGGLGSIHDVPLYPTQLMEALSGLTIYLSLAWLHKNRRFPGQVFVAYAIAYSALRFAIEFMRGDKIPRFLGEAVTQGQIISVLLVGGGIYFWWRLSQQTSKDEPDPETAP